MSHRKKINAITPGIRTNTLWFVNHYFSHCGDPPRLISHGHLMTTWMTLLFSTLHADLNLWIGEWTAWAMLASSASLWLAESCLHHLTLHLPLWNLSLMIHKYHLPLSLKCCLHGLLWGWHYDNTTPTIKILLEGTSWWIWHTHPHRHQWLCVRVYPLWCLHCLSPHCPNWIFCPIWCHLLDPSIQA